MLETRLDNVVYRLGFAGSRAQARRLSATGTSWSTGGGSTSRATWRRPDDIVWLRQGSPAEPIVRDATDLTEAVTPWLQADHDGLTGKMLMGLSVPRSTRRCRNP